MKAKFIYESVGFKRGQSAKDSLSLGYPGLEKFREMAIKHGYKKQDLSTSLLPLYKSNASGEFKSIEIWEKEIEEGDVIYLDLIYDYKTYPIIIFITVDAPRKEEDYPIEYSYNEEWWDLVEEMGKYI